jgi:hypothetical protein
MKIRICGKQISVLVSENADLSLSISFRRKRGRPVKQLSGFTPTLKAQGSADGPLRAPRKFADLDAGRSEYAAHEIVAHTLKKGADFYKMRWTGLDERGDTTEPTAHLADVASKAKIQAAWTVALPCSHSPKLCEVRSWESVVDEGASTYDTIHLDGDSPTPRHAIKHSYTSPVWKFGSPKFKTCTARQQLFVISAMNNYEHPTLPISGTAL